MIETNQKTEREKLLSEWAALAPGECQVNNEGTSFLLRSEMWIVSDVSDSKGRAILLGTLIDAVRTRRWLTQIDIEPVVSVAIYIGDSKQFDGEAPEACDALLSAYVIALEWAEKK